jgi:hypothetical protein
VYLIALRVAGNFVRLCFLLLLLGGLFHFHIALGGFVFLLVAGCGWWALAGCPDRLLDLSIRIPCTPRIPLEDVLSFALPNLLGLRLILELRFIVRFAFLGGLCGQSPRVEVAI